MRFVDRLFTEGSTKGPSKGRVVDQEAFERMLDEYYEIVGWDKRTGIPTHARLKELGILALLSFIENGRKPKGQTRDEK